jgi:hypothetical protein
MVRPLPKITYCTIHNKKLYHMTPVNNNIFSVPYAQCCRCLPPAPDLPHRSLLPDLACHHRPLPSSAAIVYRHCCCHPPLLSSAATIFAAAIIATPLSPPSLPARLVLPCHSTPPDLVSRLYPPPLSSATVVVHRCHHCPPPRSST